MTALGKPDPRWSSGGPTDLSHACLGGANLIGADLSFTNPNGAHLADAHLKGADLTHSLLNGANLSGADLTDSHLKGAYLTDAHLEGVDPVMLRRALLRQGPCRTAPCS
ncbi:pentapeptide repeat-containing protein [Saccharopolyspora sp. TS4A08]|uniref:Pentapeptide repeat-containing protein n=1 Tax=Saccharopolyspora ipomoeae TaxID=3042027 RepID=A0ABT6PWN5_9PSEU|nr:pentapeptide repeat-containing protein [Saccharopolyspora sp. TS4A08]MDI2032429.1 pentapeptide repeat-containing protein [Saccharopolyspora sp. TS4A08]